MFFPLTRIVSIIKEKGINSHTTVRKEKKVQFIKHTCTCINNEQHMKTFLCTFNCFFHRLFMNKERGDV